MRAAYPPWQRSVSLGAAPEKSSILPTFWEGRGRALQNADIPGFRPLSYEEDLLVCVGIWLQAMLLLAKGSCKTPGAQTRYDVFFRKGYEVSDITEVLSIQIEDVPGPVSEVESSDPYITGSASADAFRAPWAWRWPVCVLGGGLEIPELGGEVCVGGSSELVSS